MCGFPGVVERYGRYGIIILELGTIVLLYDVVYFYWLAVHYIGRIW